MGQSHLRRLLVVLACAALPAAHAGGPEVRIGSASGDFVFTDAQGDASRPVTVYTYLPRRADVRTAPILFVMHGFHRSARQYRDDWAYHADQYGFIVVAPLFDAKTWGSDYSYPSTKGKNRRPRDDAQTSFALIEHLFDALKDATGNTQPRYLIYGFSEGGQFVHRLVLTQPEARYARAVIGTPGWYTMPDLDDRLALRPQAHAHRPRGAEEHPRARRGAAAGSGRQRSKTR